MEEARAVRQVDETDLAILKALNEGCTEPNIRKIQRATGLHRQTIYTRLKRMQESGAIRKFTPKLDFKALGLKTQNLVLYEIDIALSQQIGTQRIREVLMEAPHIMRAYSLVPTSEYLICTHEIFEDQHHAHESLMELYRKHPEIMKIVKKRAVFTLDADDEGKTKRLDNNTVLRLIAHRRKMNLDGPLRSRSKKLAAASGA
ncbi:MAG TPA: Lrp/AsnC family transcriptional regulator [Candidatus Norongarragalinales archaeon]|nr:Lrp/AsnC family transcriptional regulator [Candidatus Norongarragalinales archaeon]